MSRYPSPSLKKARMSDEELEVWSEAYIAGLIFNPDYDGQRIIFNSYPTNLQQTIREKLYPILGTPLVDANFKITN